MRGEETFSDQLVWIEMAKEREVRLPLWRLPCTTGGMRKFLKKLDISVSDYLSYCGDKILKDFPRNNPEWPLRAWCGLILEWKWLEDTVQEPAPRRKRNVRSE